MARRDDPKDDAAVIKEIRRRVGIEVELRVDANRKWTYEKAIEFGSLVRDCGLQYIEVCLSDVLFISYCFMKMCTWSMFKDIKCTYIQAMGFE